MPIKIVRDSPAVLKKGEAVSQYVHYFVRLGWYRCQSMRFYLKHSMIMRESNVDTNVATASQGHDEAGSCTKAQHYSALLFRQPASSPGALNYLPVFSSLFSVH